MVENSTELELLFKKMLKDTIEDIEKDEVYRKDVKNFPLKVQWKINGITGYQIYEEDNYSYKYGEELENPDFTIILKDIELGKKFFSGDLEGFSYAPRTDYKGKFKLMHTLGWKTTDKGEGGLNRTPIRKNFLIARFDKTRDYHPFVLLKLPLFKKLIKRDEVDESKNFGAYLPINQSLGTFENQVLPLKVIKHFINKAAHIVMHRRCGCRVINDCQDHDRYLGCMYMGRDTMMMEVSDDRARVLTKEEAWSEVKRAYDSGLIPLLGRSMGESSAYGVEETGHFMSMCFCCSCCCVNGKAMRYGPSSVKLFPRMEGLTVKVDETKCIGCGECIKACAFKGRELVNGKAKVIQDRCLGCGRCESTCPTGATSIEIDDPKRVEEHIKAIESFVDVS